MKRILTLLAILIMTVTSGSAYDRSTWMADLLNVNPDVRLSQLSIPMAHDAGTWMASTLLVKDQCHTERELFKLGVRAFDMRIAFDEDTNHWQDIDGDGKGETVGSLRHGNFLSDMIWNLNNFYDEVQYLPTTEELGDECIMLFFQYEGSQELHTKENCKNAIDQFVYLLLLRYGEEKFVSFSPDLKLAELKGKIMLFATPELGNVCEYNINGTVPVTIVNGGSLSNEAGYLNYQTKEEQRLFRCDHDNWNLSKSKVYNDAVNMYLDYWSNIDEDNSQNYFARVNINNWWIHWGGFSYAADDSYLGTMGLNHAMSNFLICHNKPLGLLAFDFCCSTQYDNFNTWGLALSDEIIRHNFISGRFVKEIKLAVNANGNVTSQLLTDQGYDLVNYAGGSNTDDIVVANLNRSSGGGTHGDYLYMGIKYTNDPDQAIQDLIIVDYGDGSHSNTTFQWNNRTYTQVDGITSTGTFDGNLNSGGSGDNLFLYYTTEKAPNSDTPIELLTMTINDNADNLVGYLTYDDDKWEWHEKGDMSKGAGFYSEYNYLKETIHTHEYSTDVVYNVADEHHFRCKSCSKTVPVDSLSETVPMEHSYTSFSINTDLVGQGVHIARCGYCGYEEYQPCKAAKYNENGYGPCQYCNQAGTYQPAEYADSKFQISNIGQLWWFNNYVTYGAGNSVEAVLTKDIALNPDMNASMLYYWEPIGQATHTDFFGTFDGQGHTISGLLCMGEETDSVGLFSKLNYATIKNLGVTNSIYTAGGLVGTFAGYASNAQLENLYSTANITETLSSCVNYGGFVGGADNSTIRNAYYAGTLTTPSEEGTFNPAGNMYNSSMANVYFPVNERYECLDEEQASESDFALGKVCNLLNSNLEDGDIGWGQQLGVDKLPVFSTEGLYYTRSTPTGRYGTICLPSAFTVDGAKVYAVSFNQAKDAVVLTEVSETVAGTPYIYQATADAQQFTLTGSVLTAPVSASPLTGIFAATAPPVGSYVMQTKDNAQAFYPVLQGSQPTLSAYKAYLTVPDVPSEVKAISIGFEDDEDAISAVSALLSNQARICDLSGRQLDKLQRGVNIVNGKKIIIK